MAIVKMKKISLVLYDKFREESLKQLRTLGILHLEKLDGIGDKYEELYNRSEKLKNALVLLPAVKVENPAEYKDIDDALEKAEQVFSASERLKSATDRINAISKEIERIEPLGDFNPETASKLSEYGYDISVFSVNKADSQVFDENSAFRIAETKSRSYYAVVGDVPEVLAGFETFKLPEAGLNDLMEEISSEKERASGIEKEINEMVPFRAPIQKAIEDSDYDLDFEIVRSGINTDEKLSFLTGFCPVPVLDELKKKAADEGWGLMIEDPAEEDEVPTQLKLNRFSSLLTPVADFLGIVPGYREHDISFFFLCFFTVFTAMLIGDAGYGSIFLVISLVSMIAFGSKKKKIPKFFFLLLLLSAATIIWGAATGTWFASKSIMEVGFFDNLKIKAFRVSDEEQIPLIMGISFFLGIVQMLIGIVQNFKKNFPKVSSFAQIGWFAIMVSIYFLVLTLVVDRQGLEMYPSTMLYVLLGGVVIVFLFGGQEEGKSFIKGILNSLSNFLQLFLDVVGTFSDIMSYVRLFAVGLASVKIAETFNQLASQMSDGPVIIFGILIVILGHSINIVLGLMGVIVHAVRLNILEYSGKVGVEWSGFKYEPFKNK